jgi:hypothetical protein
VEQRDIRESGAGEGTKSEQTTKLADDEEQRKPVPEGENLMMRRAFIKQVQQAKLKEYWLRKGIFTVQN